jgi:small subunit ribosomal protein S6
LRYYELMMVVPQTDDEGLSATLERVNNDIGERGGTVVRQERWGGLRRLAYPINDHNEGSYVLTHLELDPERAGELEANLRVSENILRHLLLRIDSIPEARVTPVQEAPAPAAAAAAEAVPADASATAEEDVAQEATEAVAAGDEPTSEAEGEAATAEAEPAPQAETEAAATDDAPEAEAADEAEKQEG